MFNIHKYLACFLAFLSLNAFAAETYEGLPFDKLAPEELSTLEKEKTEPQRYCLEVSMIYHNHDLSEKALDKLKSCKSPEKEFFTGLINHQNKNEALAAAAFKASLIKSYDSYFESKLDPYQKRQDLLVGLSSARFLSAYYEKGLGGLPQSNFVAYALAILSSALDIEDNPDILESVDNYYSKIIPPEHRAQASEFASKVLKERDARRFLP